MADKLKVEVLAPILRVLNDLAAKHFLSDYAIGGGVGVLYYVEPVLTYDFDVVCLFPGSSTLIDPSPLFAELKRQGFDFADEDRVSIHGILVQFIPAEPGLMGEALKQAVSIQIEGVATRILRLEYLMANMLRIFRVKDRAKLALIAESHLEAVDPHLLKDILVRYDLWERWQHEFVS